MSPRSIFLASSTSCGGGQQRMAPGLAQEELQCVRRRLERRRRGWGSRLALATRVLDHVDPPLLEHPVDRVDLERGEPVRLEHLEELGRVDGARDLGGLEELNDLLGLDDAVDRGYRCFQHVSGSGYPPPRTIQTGSLQNVERPKEGAGPQAGSCCRSSTLGPASRLLTAELDVCVLLGRKRHGEVESRRRQQTDSACPRRSVVSARESTLCQVGGRLPQFALFSFVSPLARRIEVL